MNLAPLFKGLTIKERRFFLLSFSAAYLGLAYVGWLYRGFDGLVIIMIVIALALAVWVGVTAIDLESWLFMRDARKAKINKRKCST